MTKQRAGDALHAGGRGDDGASSSARRDRYAAIVRRDLRGANQDELPPAHSRRLERLATETRVPVHGGDECGNAGEDNQQAMDEYQGISLELLALMSPHGMTQQWQEAEDDKHGNGVYVDESAYDDDYRAKRLSMLARVDVAKFSGRPKNQSQEPDLTSPTQHMGPFQASPTHSAHGVEMDLASPVALQESPRLESSSWPIDGYITQEDDDQLEPDVVLNYHEPTPAKDAASAPQSSPASTARRAVPSPSTRCSPQPASRTPSKAAPAPESKPKARHGGIYSLLLKNKPPEHEPVLVDEKRSPLGPEASPRLRSVSKRTSPPSIAKLQHGGIYGLLRRNSKGAV